jgi:hypothetical protein
MALSKLSINAAQRSLIVKYFERVMSAHAVEETLDVMLKILHPDFYPQGDDEGGIGNDDSTDASGRKRSKDG